MDADHFPFSGEATFPNCATAATEGKGLPLTAGDVIKNNGEEADHKSGEKRKSYDKKKRGTSSGEEADHKSGVKRKSYDKKKRGTPSGTKADDDKKNSNRKNKGCKQNQVIIKETDHLPLYMAALKGDWNAIPNKDAKALSSPITENMETPLHVAIQTSRSNHFIRELVRVLPEESLSQKNRFGNTALHNAAIAGNVEAARIMVKKNLTLPQIPNDHGDTPLHRAAAYGHEEIVWFLLSVTHDVAPSPFEKRSGAKLLNFLISAGFYGYAFDVIKDHPELAITKEWYWVQTTKLAHEKEKDGKRTTAEGKYEVQQDHPELAIKKEGYSVPTPELAHKKEKGGKRTTAERKYVVRTPFTTLARKAEAFESKSQLGVCQWILHYIFPGNSAHKDNNNPQGGDEENPVISSETRDFEQSRFQKGTYNRQLKQIRAVDLLKLLIEEVMKHPSQAKELLASPLGTAARLGNHVFIKMIIQAYPCLILYKNEDWHNIFHISVIHGQEDVFNILFQMDSMKHFAIGLKDQNGNNMLHLAGMYKPSSKISGAALQMQREIQWFKEVEKIVQPSFKEAKNHEGKTPRQVFTEKHKDLVKEGEAWMKNAASSCSLVAALVVTVMFAAAFTVPGGNNDSGAPLFLGDTEFLTFVVSDILGLFSSSISLLMFLGMLTSRYAEDDFLVKLPAKLVIGLVTLFISLAAMLVAFSASIHILLFRKISWIWIPVGLVALMPVVVFGFMQSRLLYQIVKHTYMITIFHENPKKKDLLA